MTIRQEELIKSLVELGLPDAEAETYYHLAMLGKARAVEVAQATGHRRPDVYPILNRLVDRGLVERTTGRPSLYLPVEIGQAMQRCLDAERVQMHQMEARVNTIIQDWPRLRNDLDLPFDRIMFHQGLPQILATLKERLQEAKHSVTALLRPSMLYRLDSVRDVLAEVSRKKEVRLLTTCDGPEDLEAMPGGEVQIRHRHLPSHLEMVLVDGTETFLFLSAGRTESLHGTQEQALRLHAADITLALQAIHDVLWEQAVPLEEKLASLDGEKVPETQLLRGRWTRDQRIKEIISQAKKEVCIVAEEGLAEEWKRAGIWTWLESRSDSVRVRMAAGADIASIDVPRLDSAPAAAGLVVVDRHKAVCALRAEGGRPPESIWTTHPDMVQILMDSLPEMRPLVPAR